MATNPSIGAIETAGTLPEFVAASIHTAEVELARVRRERNEGQIERWLGYLEVVVGADLALGGQSGHAAVDQCVRYARRQECALERDRPRTWLRVMERAGRRQAIRQLWHACS